MPAPTQNLLDTFLDVVDANTDNPQILSLADRIVSICPQLTLQFDPNFDPFNPNFDPAVDTGRDTGTTQGDLVGRCTGAIEIANGAVPGLTPGAVVGVLEQIAGEEVIALDAVLAGSVRPQTQTIAARIASFSAAPSARLALRPLNLRPIRVASASSALGFESDFAQVTADTSGSFGGDGQLGGGVNGFLTGYYFRGDQDPTDLESGFDFDGFSITGGLDVAATDTLLVGLAGGYTDTNIDFDGGTGAIGSEAYTISGYGALNLSERLQASLMTSYSFIDYQSDRVLEYNDGRDLISRTATGETDATQFAITGMANYTFDAGALSWGPTVRLSHIRQHVDAFEETGAAGLNLTYEDERNFSLTTGLGLAAAYSISRSWGIVTPYARAEWEHEYEDDARLFNVRYAGDTFSVNPTSPAAFIATNAPDRDRARIGAGLSAQFRHGLSGFVDYETVVALRDVSSHTISVGLRMEF